LASLSSSLEFPLGRTSITIVVQKLDTPSIHDPWFEPFLRNEVEEQKPSQGEEILVLQERKKKSKRSGGGKKKRAGQDSIKKYGQAKEEHSKTKSSYSKSS